MITWPLRTRIIILSALLGVIVLLLIFVVYKQNHTPITSSDVSSSEEQSDVATVTTESLPVDDEIALQKQLQDILAKGKESECVKLSDSRYQVACHDLFKNMKK